MAEVLKNEIVPVALPDGGKHRVDETSLRTRRWTEWPGVTRALADERFETRFPDIDRGPPRATPRRSPTARSQ